MVQSIDTLTLFDFLWIFYDFFDEAVKRKLQVAHYILSRILNSNMQSVCFGDYLLINYIKYNLHILVTKPPQFWREQTGLFICCSSRPENLKKHTTEPDPSVVLKRSSSVIFEWFRNDLIKQLLNY